MVFLILSYSFSRKNSKITYLGSVFGKSQGMNTSLAKPSW